MSQIALPLDFPSDPGGDAFLVTPANARAVHLLDHWGAWPVRTAILTGPPRSGRSLLARVFAAKSGGSVIDDAEAVPEAELFHAWNRAQATHRPLVIVAAAAPPDWPITIPDLRSRLAASTHAALLPPDDALVRALLARLFLRRGLDARTELIDWLATRIERSYAVIEAAVALLDRDVTERQRRLSIPLARATLGEAGLVAGGLERP
ncbi:HdaA/DnaA family protein [Sphingomonas bacterium]|uniref:HdaA/DnaA family protein n=1 Tax=Sphingomonas bacterium TaxID=1895847 RepID=UPI00157541CF|nr:DnaA/Hda family protein [Sphingomonas bacterium]